MRFPYISIVVLVAVIGCASTSSVVTAKPRKGPAFVRICNVAPVALDSWVDGQQTTSTPLAPGSSSGFRITPPKDQALKLGFGQGKATSGIIPCNKSEIYTVIAIGPSAKPKYVVLSGEPRSADVGHAQIVLAHAIVGRNITASLDTKSPSDPIKAGEVTPAMDVSPGVVTVTYRDGKQVLATHDLDLAGQTGYTALLWKDGSKYRVLLLKNATGLNLGGAQGGSAAG